VNPPHLLERLLEAYGLKSLPRAGFVREGVHAPESVAAHSWGLSLLVLELLPPSLDRGRALSYAVLHDVAEARVGDITPHDGVAAGEKKRREADAMTALYQGRDPNRLAELWRAYAAQADLEARFVRQLDRLDMAIQALSYHARGEARMEPFLESAEAFIDEPGLLPLLAEVRSRFDRISADQPHARS
jgi:putative hydrolase of HD superfamily